MLATNVGLVAAMRHSGSRISSSGAGSSCISSSGSGGCSSRGRARRHIPWRHQLNCLTYGLLQCKQQRRRQQQQQSRSSCVVLLKLGIDALLAALLLSCP
jgi:hypothetical protein